MAKEPQKSVFDLVVAPDQVHKSFEMLRTSEASKPARRMIDDIYSDFVDPDGNFLEQFQTTGFDSRYFEIYLFAYFSRCGYDMDRRQPNPDFIVSRGERSVAVEATTVNPSSSGVLAALGKAVKGLSPEEFKEYVNNELAIRFGSPLFSKLQKKYWEFPHCRDMPFVIAVEAFHDEEALIFSDAALSRYLYGLDHAASWDVSGSLQVDTSPVTEHKVGTKTIPSGFFSQPGAENVSAILFTNSGTNAKFSRMGYQHGYGCEVIDIMRSGYCFNPEPSAMDPTFFSYNLDEPPFVETWGQGLVVLHNPNCTNPVSHEFFVDAVQCYLADGAVAADHRDWHPIASKTAMIHLGEVKTQLLAKIPRSPRLAVGAIPRDEFREACGLPRTADFGTEQGWFADETGSFLGVVIQDKADHDWGFVMLARDEFFVFRSIDAQFPFPSRERARALLQMRIAELFSHPKRIFPQGRKQ